MTQANVEIVLQLIDAYNRRDLVALGALSDPDLELDWSASRGVTAGVYHGIDAVRDFFLEAFAVFDETVVEPNRVHDAGESVVVVDTVRSRGREGIEVVTHSAVVYTLREGKITRIHLYQEADEALAAVGLAQ